MTTLEMILLVALIYLIVGIIAYLFEPEVYYMLHDPFYEKFIVVMDIFLWPIVVIRLIYDATCDL